MTVRDRSRENAGKSPRSYIKHALIYAAASGQIAAWAIRHPKSRMAIFDFNAGDGDGVDRSTLQPNLFGWSNISMPTAETSVKLGATYGADVYLCERDAAKREQLKQKFPHAIILSDHAQAPHYVDGYDYVLVISDPCGPKEQGIEPLKKIAALVAHSDFVIVFLEGFVHRAEGIDPDGPDTKQRRAWLTSLERYGPLVEPAWWTNALYRRQIARTRHLIKQSSNFHFRLFIVANHLSDAAVRGQFERVL